MRVALIPQDHVLSVWPEVVGYLQKAVEAPPLVRHDTTDLLEDCLTGRQLLWVIFDEEQDNSISGAFTTFVLVYPRYKSLTIPYMGGKGVWKMRDEFMRVMGKFAKENGFRTIECYGRDGWGRVGQKYGFKKAYNVFEVNVDDI